MKTRNALVIGSGILAATFSLGVVAGICGQGKITGVMEGGWNTSDFFVRVDYSGGPSEHPGTEMGNGWIRYKASMEPARLNGIRAMALAAYLSGAKVWTTTHRDRCDDATELGLGQHYP